MYLKYFLTVNCLIGTVLSFMSQSSYPLEHNSRSQAIQQKTFLWSHYKAASQDRFPTSGGSLSLDINPETQYESKKRERHLFLGTRQGIFHGPRKRRDNPTSGSMTRSEFTSTSSLPINIQQVKRGRSIDLEEVYLDPLFGIPVVKMPSQDQSNSKFKTDQELKENKNEGEVQNIQKRIGTGPGIQSWRPLSTSGSHRSNYHEEHSTFPVDRFSPIKPYVQPSIVEKWTTTLSEYNRQALFLDSYHLKENS